MGAPPARDQHGSPLLLDTVAIEVEQPSGRMGEIVETLNKGLERVDVYCPIHAISDAIDSFKPLYTSFFKLRQKEGKTVFSLAQDYIIDIRACQHAVRIAADMGPSHNDDPSAIPLLDDPGKLPCLTMIRRKGRRDPKDIGPCILDLPAYFFPSYAEMVISGIELKRASVIKGIGIL